MSAPWLGAASRTIFHRRLPEDRVAGHSHWANIARKKSLIDAKRGKLWKIGRAHV